MLRKPLAHLVLILGIIALWFAVLKDKPTEAAPAPSQTMAHRDPKPAPPRDSTKVQLELPEGEHVKVLDSRGSTALLHIDMVDQERLFLELEFSGPSEEWSFNLGDSNTNNGWGGDSRTAINDAEIQIYKGNLEIYGSDLLDNYKEYPPKQRFMKDWKNVVGDGGVVRLEIADGEVTYIDGNGQRDTYAHPALFALAGQEDPEAGVNYDLYLGVNRVVQPGRIGSGLARVKVTTQQRSSRG